MIQNSKKMKTVLQNNEVRIKSAGANHHRNLEQVGGTLYLTNKHLIFEPHFFNFQSSILKIEVSKIIDVKKSMLIYLDLTWDPNKETSKSSTIQCRKCGAINKVKKESFHVNCEYCQTPLSLVKSNSNNQETIEETFNVGWGRTSWIKEIKKLTDSF